MMNMGEMKSAEDVAEMIMSGLINRTPGTQTTNPRTAGGEGSRSGRMTVRLPNGQLFSVTVEEEI